MYSLGPLLAALLSRARKLVHGDLVFPVSSPGPFFRDVAFIIESQHESLLVPHRKVRQIASSVKLKVQFLHVTGFGTARIRGWLFVGQ